MSRLRIPAIAAVLTALIVTVASAASVAKIVDRYSTPEAVVHDKADVVIDQDTTWSGEIHVGQVTVVGGAVLTILPGSVVYMDEGDPILVYDGVLVARAEGADQIHITAEPGTSGWVGVLAFSQNGAYALVSMNNVRVDGMYSGIGAYVSGPQAIGQFADCDIQDGMLYLEAGAAIGCSLDGAGIYSYGASVTDCTVTGAPVGYNGWGTFLDNNAFGCGTGFSIEGAYVVRPVSLGRCWARDCDIGFFLRGSFVADTIKAGRATTYGIQAIAQRDWQTGAEGSILLRNVKVVDCEGPGLYAYRNDDSESRIGVVDGYFENNAVHVRVAASQGDLCPVILGQGKDYGRNQFRDGDLTSVSIENQSTQMLFAEYCYWGQVYYTVPRPVLVGLVDISPWANDPDDPYNPGIRPTPINPVPRIEASPNPFNPQTVFSLAVPRAGNVRLVIHDIRGRAVRTLVDGHHDAGPLTVEWNGTDDTGRRMATGTYFARVQHADGQDVHKVALVK